MRGRRDAGDRGPDPAGDTGLTPAERETLRLVGLVPLADAATLGRLSGLREVDSANRLLAGLARRGLAAPIRPPAEFGRPAALWHATPSGLAWLDAGGGQPGAAAGAGRRNGDRRLRGLLARLPLVEALHRLAGALAAAPGLLGLAPPPGARPVLRDWRHPWRGTYLPARDRRGRAHGATLHARAELAWLDADGLVVAGGGALLQVDLGTLPFAAWAGTIAGVLEYRDARRPSPRSYHDPRHDPLPAPVPLILVTEDPGRRVAWADAIWRGARERGRQPDDYAVAVHTWETLEARGAAAAPRAAPPVRRAEWRKHEPAAGRSAATWRGDPAGWPDALVLRPREWRCLEVLARHPFLTGGELAAVLGAPVNNVEVDRARLVARGLARLVPAPARQDGFPARGQLAELTLAGLRARARWEGTTLDQAVRHNGFVGGGEASPVGDRARLARHLHHTRGVAGVVVALYRAARRPEAAAAGAAVTLWENAAACADGWVQPDARVRVRWHGAAHEALLEYDRGTEARGRWLAKASAWAGALADGRWGAAPPVIWVVATQDGAEARIAGLLGEAGRAWGVTFPVLLTTVARLTADPDGPLGPIWRGVDDEPGDERLFWLPPGDDG